MTTATQSQNEILEALTQLEAKDLCNLIAKAAKIRKTEIDREVRAMERAAEKEYEANEDTDAYDEAMQEADEYNRDNNEWDTLLDGIKSLKSEL